MPPTPLPPNLPAAHADHFLRAAAEFFAGKIALNDLLQVIMDRVIEVTRATKGYLILAPAGSEQLDFRISRNMNREEIDNPKNKTSRKIIGEVLDGGRSVLSGNALADPRFASSESVHNLALKSILCAPLKAGRTVCGVVYLENHIKDGAFDERAREMAGSVAELASHVLGMTWTLDTIRGERDRLEEENKTLRDVIHHEYDFGRFIGRSAVMQRIFQQLEKVAASRLTVLVRGESGTGKEMVARILHERAPWRDRPFVAVNCAAVPGPLFESELFGHAKGAFTSAERARVGKVEAAEGGTLFLDEIGDLPLEIQPKLLRLLQERTFERLGENEIRRAEVRVVAATNKDIAAMVDRGQFRDDLYYRVNQLPILLPPLRERAEDIPELAEYFLRQENRKIGGFTRIALDFMKTYSWPGNVRALRNVVQRAAVYTTDGEPITDDILKAQLDEREEKMLSRSGAVQVSVPVDASYKDAIADLERAWWRVTLRRHATLSRSELAERVGIPRRTMFQRLKDLGITNGEGEG